MSGGFSLDDYATVDERIAAFYKANPKGALRRIGDPVPWTFGQRMFIAYTAGAWRDASTPEPDGVGTAWEPVPGPTPYTKDSELMNAETAAWGRAIVACGAATTKKGIASQEEVRNRQAAPAASPPTGQDNNPAPVPPSPSVESDRAVQSEAGQNGASTVQQQLLRALTGIPLAEDRRLFCERHDTAYKQSVILDLPAEKAQELLDALAEVVPA